MSDPASIRYKNPGAMWGNALAKKYGALPEAVVLHDGLGQGNNIAVFPDYVHGAAAQFALWRQSYAGMTLKAAITKWSGGNWSQPYMDFLIKNTGLSSSSPVTNQVLSGPTGLKLMKAQAQWEAGRPYPMTDEEWLEAQKMVYGAITSPQVPKPLPKPEIAPTASSEAPSGHAASTSPSETKPSLGEKVLDWLRKH